jgi:hypothetical protein
MYVHLSAPSDEYRIGPCARQFSDLQNERRQATSEALSSAMFTPVQKYVALESQKIMLFEYGLMFKLHKRSRADTRHWG